jgi:hypothetical protein
MTELFPQAREIVLVRDPRDMLASILAFSRKRGRQLFGRAAFETDEEYVRSRFFRNWIRGLLHDYERRSSTSYLLRYEDLIRTPEETLESLLAYLGVAAEGAIIDEMLEYRDVASTPSQQVHQTSANASASIGRWRQDLDKSLHVAFEEALGDVLYDLGYKEEAAPRAS